MLSSPLTGLTILHSLFLFDHLCNPVGPDVAGQVVSITLSYHSLQEGDRVSLQHNPTQPQARAHAKVLGLLDANKCCQALNTCKAHHKSKEPSACAVGCTLNV